jgi:hypothetical protein
MKNSQGKEERKIKAPAILLFCSPQIELSNNWPGKKFAKHELAIKVQRRAVFPTISLTLLNNNTLS